MNGSKIYQQDLKKQFLILSFTYKRLQTLITYLQFLYLARQTFSPPLNQFHVR